jgi:hypothetical protein
MPGNACESEVRTNLFKVLEFGLADPSNVENQSTLLDNVSGFERFKISASLCCRSPQTDSTILDFLGSLCFRILLAFR